MTNKKAQFSMNSTDEKNEDIGPMLNLSNENVETSKQKRNKFKGSRGLASIDSGISLNNVNKGKQNGEKFKNTSFVEEEGSTGNRRKSQWQTSNWKKVLNSTTFKYTLSQLARDGESDVLKSYLESLPAEKCRRILNNNTDEDGVTALHMAARQNHFETTELLLKYGATPPGGYSVDFAFSILYNVKMTQFSTQDANTRSVTLATPLHFAARYQQIKRGSLDENDDEKRSVIKLLHEFGAHVNAVDFEGLSALHYACVKGNLKCVKEILQCEGVNIELKDTQGMTALHVAATHGYLEIIKVLLNNGAKLDTIDNDQMTVLHFACTEDIIEVIDVIMEQLQSQNKGDVYSLRKHLISADAGKNTCLHVAVSKGHSELVRKLIDWAKKAMDIKQFVNVSRSHGDTPLHIAASQGHYEICEILVNNGANYESRNHSLSTPLLMAAQQNHSDIIKLLHENGADLENSDKDNLTGLLVASKHGHMETVIWLIENGANVAASDKNDKNCLMLAVEENRRAAVEELLEFDCIQKLIKETDINANSVLHLAAIKGYTDIMKLFLDRNCRIDCKNEDEATPLHMAAMFGRNDVLKDILEHDKNSINAVDENANTALHLAAIDGHRKCVQSLIKLGANVGLRNTKQWTALDCACSGGYEGCVFELLNHGAQVNPPNGLRTTPLHQACLNGHVQVVKSLLDWRADSGAVASDDRNALDCAIDKSHESCVEAILAHPTWKNAMRNAYIDPVSGEITTPLRKLIIKMPELAETAFSNCIIHNRKPLDHPKFEVTLDYEFLDDMYLVTEWLHKNKVDEDADYSDTEDGQNPSLIQTNSSSVPSGPNSAQSYANKNSSFNNANLKLQIPDDPVEYVAFSDKGKVMSNAMTYTSDANLLRHNHPLMIMVSAKREVLLQHPVVTSLLEYKWSKYGGLVYYMSLIFLILFVALLNFYMISLPAPYTIDYLKSLANRRFYNEFTAQHIINYTSPSPFYSVLDEGLSYRGYSNVTLSGKPCLFWDDTQTNSKVYPDSDLTMNYCRNPGSVMEFPWCFTNYSALNIKYQVREECDVPRATVFATSSRLPLGSTCEFPFLYQDLNVSTCLARSSGDWCAVTYDYDSDRKWGYCSTEDPYCDVPHELKRVCGTPGTDKLNCEARGCCYRVYDEGMITEYSECYQKFDTCSNRDSYCEVYANRGECVDDYDDMLSKCPLACGFCNVTEEKPDEDRIRFLYVMSLYPFGTFDVDWKPLGYYCLPGAFKLWGSEEMFKNNWEDALRLFVLILSIIHLFRLVMQIWTYKLEGITPVFFLEFSLYILSILLMLNLKGFDLIYTDEMLAEEELYVDLVYEFQSETGIRQNWQWQCGAMALFLSWMNLLLYIQKIPHLGIYVVMFNDVFKTFVKFSLVFLLFILSFAFTFHTLLQNEVEFEFTFGSILKTTVMMVGELDFSGIFIGGEAYGDKVNYSIVTYIVFVMFIVVMMIIIMNLLVGLAVGDIIAVQESATLSRLKMQVELALEVEFTVPNFIRKRLVEKTHVFHPNKYRQSNKLKRLIFENKSVSTKRVIGVVNVTKTETQEIHDTIEDIQVDVQWMKTRQTESDSLLRELMTEVKKLNTDPSARNRRLWASGSRSISPRTPSTDNFPLLAAPEEAKMLLAPQKPRSIFEVSQQAQTPNEPPTIRLDFGSRKTGHDNAAYDDDNESDNPHNSLPIFTDDGRLDLGNISREDYFV